jgi:hypothetical protein
MFPPQTQPARVMCFNRGYGYAVSGVSGTIAAGLAQDSVVFALLCDPQASIAAGNKKLGMYFDRLHLVFTTIVAFTTAVTAARRLGVYRAAGAAATLGTALAVAKKDAANAPTSVCTDARISAAAALGFTATREAAPIGTLDLTHVGAAGARQDFVYELAAPFNSPIVINAGELLVVSNPVAMDAGGTWQLTVKEAHWIEARREEIIG